MPLPNDGAIVLPVNEFFDRECFEDPKTSAGAFVNAKFAGSKFDQFLSAVINEKERFPHQEVPKERGLKADSFGIGTCLSIKHPAGLDCRLILASVATKRESEGLRAEFSFISEAVRHIRSIIADERIDSLVMPLPGAGKAGLQPEVALFATILAFSEVARGSSGHLLKSVEIVVFQSDDSSKPVISKSRARSILGTASAMIG